jgi:hypothetical protein
VEQLSLPYRIAIVALLAVGVLWFAVLRPKSANEATPAATQAPGVTGLANDVSKAKGAVDASNAGAAATKAAADAAAGDAPAAKPATTAKPAPAAKATKAPKAVKPAPKPAKPGLAADAAPGDPSRPLLADVDAGKVVVALFWNKEGSDDRATRRALRAVNHHHGKVVTTAIPVSEVGKYEAITRGAQVLESPTVLVIGAGGKARAITGYTQPQEIDQAVSDIGGKGFEAKKAFQLTGLSKVADDVCKDFHYAVDQKSDPPTSVDELSKMLGIAERQQTAGVSRLNKAKAASAAERDLKAAMLAFAKKDSGWVADAQRKLKAGAEPGSVFLSLVGLEVGGSHAYQAAAKKVHARGCYTTAG